ncbi:uncharacterized protein LOC135687541 isoform X1 [Rhopilema esculentum]|uniref:uncharacterized protein LOC135687541 isoform X1 n=1 Tax=Rhopilema esculentum TaxID=499914 RepID=UPI0031E3CE71
MHKNNYVLPILAYLPYIRKSLTFLSNLPFAQAPCIFNNLTKHGGESDGELLFTFIFYDLRPNSKNSCYKSILHYLWQQNLSKTKPVYTIVEGCSNGRKEFSAILLFEGQKFHTSSPQPSKKRAEQNVAEIACRYLSLCAKKESVANESERIHSAADKIGSTSSNKTQQRDVNMEETKTDIYAVEQQIEPMYFDFEKDNIEDYDIVRSGLSTSKDNEIEDTKIEVPGSRKVSNADKFDEVSGKAYKSLLNELAQKHNHPRPIYTTKITEGPNFQLFGVVEFCGKTYCGAVACKNKKNAEHSAAKACWEALDIKKPKGIDENLFERDSQKVLCQTVGESLPSAVLNNNSLHVDNLPQREIKQAEHSDHVCLWSSQIREKVIPQNVRGDTPKSVPVVENYKGLLDEHLMQRGLPQAAYTRKIVGGAITVTCGYEGWKTQLQSSIQKRKEIEQEAAKQALISLGIEDPEKVIRIRNGSLASKLKRKSSDIGDDIASKRARHDGDAIASQKLSSDPQMFNFDHGARNQDILERERALLSDDTYDSEHDPLSVWGLGEPRISGVPVSRVTDLSVCEDWPDKTNILIVGNTEFSIPLKCLGITKELICHKERRRVRLRPGANIRGLVCKYYQQGNQIYLRGKSCEEILYPLKPKPVLLSCGVVMIHFDTKLRDSLQVLLKRYVTSPAFIHVSASLAQWFRRYFSGRPMKLDVDKILQHVQFWLDSEVKLLSEMKDASIKQLFLQWNFKDSWSRLLQSHLPEDLRKLQKRCRWELQRRHRNKRKCNDVFEKPWNLPKGVFKHRLLTTGIFMESSSECAYRELREETGIVISPSEIAKFPYVDIEILEHENFNPHKGDFTRYYLCLNKPRTTGARGSEGTLLNGESTNANHDNIYLGMNAFQTNVHEECQWMSIGKALEASATFKRITETVVFQDFINTVTNS